jgi:hypothetical protein
MLLGIIGPGVGANRRFTMSMPSGEHPRRFFVSALGSTSISPALLTRQVGVMACWRR